MKNRAREESKVVELHCITFFKFDRDIAEGVIYP